MDTDSASWKKADHYLKHAFIYRKQHAKHDADTQLYGKFYAIHDANAKQYTLRYAIGGSIMYKGEDNVEL